MFLLVATLFYLGVVFGVFYAKIRVFMVRVLILSCCGHNLPPFDFYPLGKKYNRYPTKLQDLHCYILHFTNSPVGYIASTDWFKLVSDTVICFSLIPMLGV